MGVVFAFVSMLYFAGQHWYFYHEYSDNHEPWEVVVERRERKIGGGVGWRIGVSAGGRQRLLTGWHSAPGGGTECPFRHRWKSERELVVSVPEPLSVSPREPPDELDVVWERGQ